MLKYSLSDDLVTAFKNLPNISRPELLSSWNKYHDFLKTYGSHVVTLKNYGASLKHWTFSKKEHQYSEEQLNIRSCLDFGISTFVLGVCGGISEANKKSVTNLFMSSKTEIRGGRHETGTKLRQNRSNDLINQLLNEGRQNETPLNYQYTPIWEILRSRFSRDSNSYPAALNLEQYYLGYLDFGCSLQTPDMRSRRSVHSMRLPRSVDDIQLRRFEANRYSTKKIQNTAVY